MATQRREKISMRPLFSPKPAWFSTASVDLLSGRATFCLTNGFVEYKSGGGDVK